jgi:hypothetical protein
MLVTTYKTALSQPRRRVLELLLAVMEYTESMAAYLHIIFISSQYFDQEIIFSMHDFPIISVIALMMEEVNFSEISVSIYQTTTCNIPYAGHLHIHHCENLISHTPTYFSFCLQVIVDQPEHTLTDQQQQAGSSQQSANMDVTAAGNSTPGEDS